MAIWRVDIDGVGMLVRWPTALGTVAIRHPDLEGGAWVHARRPRVQTAAGAEVVAFDLARSALAGVDAARAPGERGG